MPHCLFKKTTACRMAACTEAQGVRCCAACPYKKCPSRCRVPDQKAEAKKTPADAGSDTEQIKMEVFHDG